MKTISTELAKLGIEIKGAAAGARQITLTDVNGETELLTIFTCPGATELFDRLTFWDWERCRTGACHVEAKYEPPISRLTVKNRCPNI